MTSGHDSVPGSAADVMGQPAVGLVHRIACRCLQPVNVRCDLIEGAGPVVIDVGLPVYDEGLVIVDVQAATPEGYV